MVLGAKARAVLHGRYYVSKEDICALAAPVLRHRIKTNFSADAEGVTTDAMIARLIESVPAVSGDKDGREEATGVFRSADAG